MHVQRRAQTLGCLSSSSSVVQKARSVAKQKQLEEEAVLNHTEPDSFEPRHFWTTDPVVLPIIGPLISFQHS